MYGWLSDALRDDATVITANRRLARVLTREHSELQLRAARSAWQSPAIHAWSDWLKLLLRGDAVQSSMPTLLDAQQSRLLWERCLARELPAAAGGLPRLVRLCREAWQRASDWQVSIRDIARAAQTDDQRLFASVCGRYLGILDRERWADEAVLAALVLERIEHGSVQLPASVTLAGFNRLPPVVEAIAAACTDAGVSVATAPTAPVSGDVRLHEFEDEEAELRAAGAWARRHLEEERERRVAIVATHLEQDTKRKARLVREGCVPGWQYAARGYRDTVNVSLGRPLSEYPAVAIALLLLRWLARDLSSIDVCQLLRSPLIGNSDTAGRHRLELGLRRLPERRWAPALLSAQLRAGKAAEGSDEWLRLVSRLTRWRREIPARRPPAEWALLFDDVLAAAGWPGHEPLDSDAFQVVNRWRELLNDLARLGLVSRAMDLSEALRRLELMAAETIFQPESRDAPVQLLGPLEAAGSEFDAVWISGLTASNWPPAGNASPLLSLRLQRDAGMPDADPADTLEFAAGLIERLGGAGREVVCSYARRADDAEQTASSLVDGLQPLPGLARPEPGWHAARLSSLARSRITGDVIPAVDEHEQVTGGAATIQQQLTDPLSAFIGGRLGVTPLQPQVSGLHPPLRGSILHDALHALYAGLPSRAVVAGWQDGERNSRISSALDSALHRHLRHADDVLARLLELERRRLARLLRRFLAEDVSRDDFTIAAIEHEIDFAEAGIRMSLRADRIDRLADGALAVLDYKSGARKRFLDGTGQPREFQLVAYACAIDEPVAALVLVNIDSREIVFDGAGCGYAREGEWPAALEEWKALVRGACADLSRGDVRLDALQSVLEARPLNLLSRYNELRRDGR